MTTPFPPVDPSMTGGLTDTPAPSEPASVLSDRAGDVLGIQDGSGRSTGADPLTHAIMTLDAASAATSTYGNGTGHEAPARSRRREIIDAASELFALRGYRGTSLRDISGKVGISHPGMLHHFRSKDALLDAVVDDLESHAQHVIDNLQAYDTSFDRLERIVRRNFSEGTHRMLLFAVLSHEAIDPEYPARLRLIRLRRVHEHIAERVVRTYAERGLLVEGLDIAWAARLLISITLTLSTREATIGAVQPSSAGVATSDFVALMKLLTR